jgi:hypothetical protein
MQLRFDWPHDLLTYFQEWGRGSQQNGSKSICILYANPSSYVSLVLQIVGAADCMVEETATSECDGYNSAILPTRQFQQVNTSQFELYPRTIGKKTIARLYVRRITSGGAILLPQPRRSTCSGWVIFIKWFAWFCTCNQVLQDMSHMHPNILQGLPSSVLGQCFCIYWVVDCDIKTSSQNWIKIASILIINDWYILEGDDFWQGIKLSVLIKCQCIILVLGSRWDSWYSKHSWREYVDARMESSGSSMTTCPCYISRWLVLLKSSLSPYQQQRHPIVPVGIL